MKKTKFLVLALALAVMLVGAGYAYWSDSFTIHGTVKTGTFGIDLGYSFISATDNLGNDCIIDAEANRFTGEDYIEFEVLNLYPGVTVQCYSMLNNIGSVDGKLSAVRFELINPDPTFPSDAIKIWGSVRGETLEEDLLSNFISENTEDGKYVLYPDTEIEAYGNLEFNLYLQMKSDTSYEYGQNKELKAKIIYDFEQYNAE